VQQHLENTSLGGKASQNSNYNFKRRRMAAARQMMK